MAFLARCGKKILLDRFRLARDGTARFEHRRCHYESVTRGRPFRHGRL
jgi:hypothetical protein